MRSVRTVVAACVVALAGLAFSAPTQAEGQGKAVKAGQAQTKKDAGWEHLKQIERALKMLQEARKVAEGARGTDWGGHGHHAMRDIDGAIKQLRDAVAYFKKHHKKK